MTKRVHYPIAFCPDHGIFPAKAFPMAAGAAVHISGIDTNCPIPNCNRACEIIPALYEAKVDRLNVLLDPSISIETLAVIRSLALELQKGKITPAKAKKAAEKIHPAAARLFDISNWSDQARVTLYAAIIGAAAVIYAAKIASPPSQNVLVQLVVERIVTKDDLLTTSSLTRPAKIPLPRPRPKSHR
jgi:hypothetical protein